MQDSVFEFWSGDYELRLYVDRLDSFPIKNFRLCLRILREYPEDLDRLKAALQQYTGQAEESWNSASEAFVNGYWDGNSSFGRGVEWNCLITCPILWRNWRKCRN